MERIRKTGALYGLGLLLLLFPVFVQGQAADTIPTPKKWYKQVKLTGIGAAYGAYSPFEGKRRWRVFENTVMNEGAHKYDEDIKNISAMQGNRIREDYNEAGSFNFRFTLKSEDTLAPYWVRFGEFGIGLRAMYNYSEYMLCGDSAMVNNKSAAYRASYSQHIGFAGLDVSYVIQTPAFFDFFSLYTGTTLNVGVCFTEWTSTGDSRYYISDESNFLIPSDFDTTYQLGHEQFYEPGYMLGLYLPIGLKINISPRVNLFAEYVFLAQTIFYKNNYSLSDYYQGFEFGIRYKLNPNGERVRKKRLSNPPQPFY